MSLIFANVHASLYVFFFSFASFSWFCQCSMPLLCIFSFLLCLCFASVLCLFIYILSFLSCLWLGILPLFYASLFNFFSFLLWLWPDFANALCLFIYIFIFLVPVPWFLPMFYASSFIFYFLLCLWLGFVNVLCLFICIFFFSFLSVSWFCRCSLPLY